MAAIKARTHPKPYCREKLYDKRKEIGYIQLVSYLRGEDRPHIEFYLEKEYRNQGIMSRELPKYLKKCKKYDHNVQLIAVVKPDNNISKKLLIKNGFVQISDVKDHNVFIIDLRFTAEFVQKLVLAMKNGFNCDVEELRKQEENINNASVTTSK